MQLSFAALLAILVCKEGMPDINLRGVKLETDDRKSWKQVIVLVVGRLRRERPPARSGERAASQWGRDAAHMRGLQVGPPGDQGLNLVQT